MGIATALLVTVFLPWVYIQSAGLTISGLHAEGTTYGKPGMLSLILVGLVWICAAVPRVWAHRAMLISSALHVGWAVRNFFTLSVCQGGECPQRLPAFYAYFVLSFLLLLAVLLQLGRIPVEEDAA